MTLIVTRGEEEIEGDAEGRLVLHAMMEEREGDYSCQVLDNFHQNLYSIKATITTITISTTMMEKREGDYSCQVCNHPHNHPHQSHHHHHNHYDGGEGARETTLVRFTIITTKAIITTTT